MASVTILSDNGATSGSAGLKTSGGNDGVLLLQTTTSGGTPTTAISISNTQVVTYTNQPTYTGGTANGVLYLNGSKAVTSGTALVFDGSNLGIGTSAPGSKLDILNTTTAQAQFSYSATIFGRIGRLSSGNYEFSAYENGANLIFGTSTTNGATTERMRLDSSGNLGLGVTPSAWGGGYRAFQFNNTGRSLAGTGAGAGDLTLAFNAVYDSTNARWQYAYTGDPATRYSTTGGQHIWYTAATGTAGNAISFTQAMTLDASGNLLVARTAAEGTTPSKIQVVGSGNLSSITVTRANTAGIYLAESTNTANYGTGIWFDHGSLLAGIASSRVATNNWGTDLRFYTHPTTTSGVSETYERGKFTAAGDFQLYITAAKDGQLQWYEPANNIVRAFVYANGVPELVAQCGGSGGVKLTSGATSWVSASDIRNKDIIEPIANAIQKVGSLSSVIYSFKDDVEQTRRVGLIAQEVLAVLPEAVYVPSDEEEMLGVRYTEVVPLIVAAIKELKAEVDALKGQA